MFSFNITSVSYLLHNIFPDILWGMNKFLVQYNYHRSCIADSIMLFDNIDPYILPSIDKFCHDYTNRCSHIFYCILGLVLDFCLFVLCGGDPKSFFVYLFNIFSKFQSLYCSKIFYSEF